MKSHIHSIKQVGDNWKDKSLLQKALDVNAARTGFAIAKCRDRIFSCSRVDTKKKKCAERLFSSGPLQAGCKFQIRVKPSRHYKHVTKKKDGSMTSKHRSDWSDETFVTITAAITEHCGGCQPSPMQQVMQKNRAGKYVNNITEMSMYALCNARLRGKPVDTQVRTQCSREPYFFGVLENHILF